MSKFVQGMMITLLTIALIATGVYFFYFKSINTAAGGDPSIDEILKSTIDIPEITTNLLGDDYVKVAFKIQADSSDTKKELEKRDFQIKNVIIKQLSGMEADDLEGTEGKIHLEEELKTKLTAIIGDGKIDQIYITSCIIQ